MTIIPPSGRMSPPPDKLQSNRLYRDKNEAAMADEVLNLLLWHLTSSTCQNRITQIPGGNPRLPNPVFPKCSQITSFPVVSCWKDVDRHLKSNSPLPFCQKVQMVLHVFLNLTSETLYLLVFNVFHKANNIWTNSWGGGCSQYLQRINDPVWQRTWSHGLPQSPSLAKQTVVSPPGLCEGELSLSLVQGTV